MHLKTITTAALLHPVQFAAFIQSTWNTLLVLGSISHGMRNEFALRSRTGVRASFMALTFA